MRHLTVVLGLVASLYSPEPAASQASSASLTVSANVVKNCTISTTPINFGSYDPVEANATRALDGLGTIVVTCTQGTSGHIGLSQGSNAVGSVRRMEDGSQYLVYEIYKDPGRTQPWGNGFSDNLDVPGAPNLDPRTFTAYGRVPAGQDVRVGQYLDVVIATVNF